ncbi:MAGUK p55 subfamily member 7 isoform X2 [Helicoverpa armigera]|uniref:MAGUK p55 subfamily member 7 isoform X2 n=1 Tax=Helicoverpa armigera TaxID=29058 RepID=UPI000B3746F3|nr:MAGUK p55 subfamily member 7 isoform X2 [Helicoverpa armigera]XP_047041207.1 MAGUK p55 subfamily member 7 isoform X2 [Helicoverpa zea]
MDSSAEHWDPALTRLLASLKEVQSGGEDVAFLSELLQSKQLHALVQVHNKIVAKGKDDKFYPILSNAMQVTLEVFELLHEVVTVSKEYGELLSLLQKPHFQAILCTHDAVAQKDYYPHLPDIPPELDDEEETVKIVQLVKSDEPLGATIKTDEETGKIVIARVMHGGAADRSGLIHAGDEVIEVNGISVENKTPADVLSILQSSEGTITFKLVPSFGKGGSRESKVRVRALFNYNSSEDPYIPCKEAGLDFKKGDVLHIVSQDDAYWWQARREGDRVMRAGLIPSRALQEGRIIHERQTDPQTLEGKPALCSSSNSNSDCGPKTPCSPTPTATALLPCKSTPKVKKVIYDITENDDFDREIIPTYEEVARLYPRPGMVRPIVLVGAPGVGRNELRRRLIATDPEKYVTPIPFTSRPPKASEQNGKDYMFVSREKMEQDIGYGKFIEHGEYKGNLYGTSEESVESIINSGRVCVLSPHWQALKMLRTPRLRPYIVFIRPPPLERLVETRTAANARSSFDKESSRAFTENEFSEMVRSSNRINFLYGYMFDDEIVNEDLAGALSQLLKVVWRVQSEPLWVPASWVQ